MRKVAGQREARCALVVDFASRLTRQPDHLDANEHRFFVAAERISLAAHPIVPKGADIATVNGKAHFNPILWLVNRGQDLPSWLALDSTRVSVLSLGLPDYETRLAAGSHLGNLFAGFDVGADEARGKFARNSRSTPMACRWSRCSTSPNSPIARALGFATRRCHAASRSAPPRIAEDYLRERIADALPFIEERVRGHGRRSPRRSTS